MDFPLYANHETSIGFFLGDTSIHTYDYATKAKMQSMNRVFIFGVSTQCKGSMASKGNYNTFTIGFKPNGFTKIFGIPASQLSNSIFPAHDIIGSSITRLHEKLLHASSSAQIVRLADDFLLNILKGKKISYINNGISKISNYLLTHRSTFTIPQYAYEANMSLRNFERIFREQVGIAPKLFCRLLRFNAAFQYKICQPKITWNEIAIEFGYSDTMHLIKEFKQFTNSSPANLINENTDFVENSCYKIRPVSNDLS